MKKLPYFTDLGWTVLIVIAVIISIEVISLG